MLQIGLLGVIGLTLSRGIVVYVAMVRGKDVSLGLALVVPLAFAAAIFLAAWRMSRLLARLRVELREGAKEPSLRVLDDRDDEDEQQRRGGGA